MLGKLDANTIILSISILLGFLTHLFYFGKSVGELKTDVRHLSKSLDEFKGQNFISRAEYETRHLELLTRINSTKGDHPL